MVRRKDGGPEPRSGWNENTPDIPMDLPDSETDERWMRDALALAAQDVVTGSAGPYG